jgi:predicted amidohydrolase
MLLLTPLRSLARYHKLHPWHRHTFDKPKLEVVTFTKFGRTFGLLVCYDLVHFTPATELLAAGATDFPYSVVVPTELNRWQVDVSSVSRDAFTLWARVHRANLLASNGGVEGSGVFLKDGQAFTDRTDDTPFIIADVL